MNVQTVSFMPASSSMDLKENRADAEAFSKELERKIDAPKASSPLGRDRSEVQSAKNEVKNEKTSSVERKEIKDSEKKSESGEARLSKKQTPKQERLKKFMDSLESEFQIPPTRIVEAFSQLSPQELSLPADQSIDRIVEKLDLDSGEAAKVKDLYGDLVQDLDQIDSRKQQTSFNPAPSALTLGMEQTRARFDKAKSQKLAVQKTLDQMNQSFWQPQVLAPGPQVPQSEILTKPQTMGRDRGTLGGGLESYRDISMAGTMMALPIDEVGFQGDQDLTFDSPPTGDQINMQTQNQRDQSKAAMFAGAGLMGRQTLEGESDQAMTMAAMDTSRYGMNKSSEISLPSKSGQANKALEEWSINPMDHSTNVLSKLADSSGSARGSADFFSQGEKHSSSSKSDLNLKKASGDEMKAMMASLGMSSELKDAPVAAPTQSVPMAPDVVDRNIQNVMQQAQYLIKNGGGEMKVKMTPEGLGEIQLHVELKAGRVQVHMLAENKETRKMLESGLSDLKDSLTQQNIALDSVKIDSVVKTNVENQAHNNNHFNQNQNQNQDPREQRQFWNQFQEQFGGRPQREALFEPPKVRGYAAKKTDAIGPAENSSSTRSAGKSSSLNLVA
ncbi:MAG: flagellar hook-length control protein FliK [Bdellovibrionaceae bacterium]|nr:flagellar hook-length control protein FliK [Pseudobdellovibrionaceae bacterium]